MSCTELEDISHTLFPVKSHLKTELLRHILETTETGAVIVCTRTRLKAKKTAQHLTRSGLRAVSLENRPEYAGLPPLQAFTEEKVDILVVYEAAAEEVPSRPLTHLIYHDIPYTAKGYFRLPEHLSPEARPGEIFSLISAETSGAVHSLEMYLERDLERRLAPDFNYELPSRPSSGREVGSSPTHRPGTGKKGRERPGYKALRHRGSSDDVGSGHRKHRGTAPAGNEESPGGSRKHVPSRSHEGGRRHLGTRPGRKSDRSGGSSREWMEKDSRHRMHQKSGSGEGGPRRRPASPSPLPGGPKRTTRKKSIFGITAPGEWEGDD